MLAKLKRIRVYLPFAMCNLKSRMSYRFNFLMTIIGQVVKSLVIFFLWKSVFDNSANDVINGFTSDEMMIYVFMSAVTANMINNATDAFISYEVRDGTIATSLIKPISMNVKLFFEAVADFVHGGLFVALPMWIGMIAIRYSTVRELPPNCSVIVLYLISAILGFVLLYAFNFCFGILSFYVTNIWGIRNLKYILIDFFSGVIVPIAFFPSCIKAIISWLPFASMNYTPVLIYSGKLQGIEIIQSMGLQVVWIIILICLGKVFWNRATNRLTILGG